MESPQEITVELMQQILREVEKDSTITILPCLVVDELNKDRHGGSCMSRVIVRYITGKDQSEHTLSLVVKILPKILPSLTEAVGKSTMFHREIQMFDEILPRMSALLKSGIPDRHTDFFARVYYTQKTPSYFIAIEDLAPKGFVAPKRKKGLDLKHCQLVFKMLARFHAASVIICNDDKSLFSVFDEYSFQEEALNKMLLEFSNKFSNIVIRAVKNWPEFGPSWANRLQNCYKTMNEDLRVIWKRKDNAFSVLNHGDFGIHNMMFRYSESGNVEDIMLVDFQCCSYNSPVLDLIQLLFSSATDEVRANHIDTLLKEYHNELTATLESLGAPKEQTISLTQLFQEFESKMVYALFYATTFLPLLCLDSDSGITPEELFKLTEDETDKYDLLITKAYTNTLKILLPIFSHKKLI